MKKKPTMTVQSNFDAKVAAIPVIGGFINSVSAGNAALLLLIGIFGVAVYLFYLVAVGKIDAPWVTHAMMKKHTQRIEYLAKKSECRHETDKAKQQECWTELSKLIDTTETE